MKKIITVLLMMAVMLCGCGEGEKQEVSQEQNQEETEKYNSESGNQETEEEIKETEDMSQAEWMESGGADNMEDGYEKVESINIDSSDTKLSYEKLEKYKLENGEEVILLYFDFSNVSAGETTVDGQYNFSAFQDGVEITVYSYVPDEFEPFRNRDKQILDGANIKFGIAVKPDNWESNIKLRVDDCMAYDSQDIPHTFQQQELELTQDETLERNENDENNINSIFQKEYEVDGEKINISLDENDGKMSIDIFGNTKDEEKASIMLACFKKSLSEISIDGYSITIKTGEASVIYKESEGNNTLMGTNRDGSIAFSTPDWLVTEFTMPEEEINSFTDEIINTMEDFGESAEMNN